MNPVWSGSGARQCQPVAEEEPGLRPDSPRLLRDPGQIAELPLRGEAGLFGRQTVGELVGRARLEVEARLLGHLTVEFSPEEERAETVNELEEKVHRVGELRGSC